MNKKMKQMLERLRLDYAAIEGKPFNHFYCPILFRDEDVPLCQAHIINKAFAGSSRAWTIQRMDVDNFYGSNFESDFEVLQYGKGLQFGQGSELEEIFMDKELHKKFGPKILVDDKQVEFFVAQGTVPEQYTAVEFEKDGHTITIGLKMAPQTVLSMQSGNWQIDVSKDLRIASLVSIIKAAYLTLFEILGYRYVFSAAGDFIGRHILGEFFLQNQGKPKSVVKESAFFFFSEFAHMVRPLVSSGIDFQGSVTDMMFLVCWSSSGFPWAIIVFVRTGILLHSVMLPISDRADMLHIYFDFLKNPSESISVRLCRLDQQQNQWNINKEPILLAWPKTGILKF